MCIRDRLRLAFSMGYADWDALARELARHTDAVSRQFAQVFGDATPQEPVQADLGETWRGDPGEESALALLAEYGFEEPARAWNRLRALKTGLTYRTMSPRGRERLDLLIPRVLEAVHAMPQPTATLERILNLLETVARRSVYLALLTDQPQALAQLVKLCAASGWISHHLTRYPCLLYTSRCV